jgi:arginase family enzyme
MAADLDAVTADLRKRASRAKRIWIDVDADVFDPAFAPAVHQPMPFGLTPMQFLRLLEAAWSGKVIGLSVSEFDPGRDVRDVTLNLLGWLLERVLLKRYEPGGNR